VFVVFMRANDYRRYLVVALVVACFVFVFVVFVIAFGEDDRAG
jgi:hypothetical protein